MKKTIFLFFAFGAVLTGCFTTSKLISEEPLDESSQGLPYEIQVSTLNRDSHSITPASSEIVKIKDAENNVYFSLRAEGKVGNRNTFAGKYIDEYLYFIQLYLSSEYEENEDVSSIGLAHSSWKHMRINFLKNGEYLGVQHCPTGVCDDKQKNTVYYDNEGAGKLLKHLKEFQRKHANHSTHKFESSPPMEGKARVYLYRLNTIPVVRKAPIHMNGKPLVKLLPKKYMALELDPGSYEFEAKWDFLSGVPKASKTLTVESGKIYYLKYTSSVSGKPSRIVLASQNAEHDSNPMKLEYHLIAENEIGSLDIQNED